MSDEEQDLRDFWDNVREQEERRQWVEWLTDDPGYLVWLDSLNKELEATCPRE